MIYAKFKSETEIQRVPVNFIDMSGHTFLNFNCSPESMALFGFKPLDESDKPEATAYTVSYVNQDEVIKAVYVPLVIVKTDEEIKREFINAVQDYLDGVARTRAYDDIFTACTYASSSVQKFAHEGQACLMFRDAVWSYCYAQLEKVKSGERLLPSIENFIAELPEIRW